MARKRRESLEQQLDTLCQLRRAGVWDEATRATIRAGIVAERGLVVAEAARAAQEGPLLDMVPALKGAFQRLLVQAVKRDPGCLGKLAILDALDGLEDSDDAPFLLGSQYVQREPAFGGPIDTAAAVRSRSAAALARLHHPDVLLILAKHVADVDASVRRAALATLAYHGQREGAALAVLKLQLGDDDPMVVAEAVNTLLELVPDWAGDELRPRLTSADPDEREVVSMAIGQHRSREALALLIAWYETLALSDDRCAALAAIGMHRSDEAREFLLERLATGSAVVARAVIEVLSVHRYDENLRRATRAAAQRNAVADLGRDVELAFDEP